MTRVPLSCPACSQKINYYFPSDLPSIWLHYPLPPSFPSFCLALSATIATSQTHISILFLFFHAVNFVPLLPFSFLSFLLALFSVDIWLLFWDLKLRVPPTPSVRLMFDKGPLKCADFRGCLADGLVGLQRVQAGGLPSERDQLLPRHRYPIYPFAQNPGAAKGTGQEKIWGGMDGGKGSG